MAKVTITEVTEARKDLKKKVLNLLEVAGLDENAIEFNVFFTDGVVDTSIMVWESCSDFSFGQMRSFIRVLALITDLVESFPYRGYEVIK